MSKSTQPTNETPKPLDEPEPDKSPLHPDDWESRPEFICMGCGFHIRLCTGSSPNCVKYVNK